MDARITELKAEAKTNADLVITQRREINRLQAAAEGLTNQVAEYKVAVESLQAKLKEAYDGIQKQNEAMKELVAQRDEFVKEAQRQREGAERRSSANTTIWPPGGKRTTPGGQTIVCRQERRSTCIEA